MERVYESYIGINFLQKRKQADFKAVISQCYGKDDFFKAGNKYLKRLLENERFNISLDARYDPCNDGDFTKLQCA